MNAGSPTTSIGFAVAKKAMSVNEELGQQALSLIEESTASSPTGPGNAPKQTSGVHIVA